MPEEERLTMDDMMALAFAGQAPGVSRRHVEMKTPSGRTFRYELSEFPISSSIMLEEAETLARRIFREKYRYCEWDRSHPEVDVEQEMIDKIVRFILSEAQAIRRAEVRRPKVYACWGIFRNGQLLEEFPYSARADAEQRLSELLAEYPGQCYISQTKRTGAPPE
jgi:hypothetical protein